MVANDLPIVSVWADAGSQWNKVGEIAAYESLSFEPRNLEPGTWQMSLPYDDRAQALIPSRLVTIDWRGKTTTWTIETFTPSADEQSGIAMLAVGGTAGMSILGRELAWPNPANSLATQPYIDPTTTVTPVTAETFILNTITGNFVTRRGVTMTVPASGGRGATVQMRPNFDNLLELVLSAVRASGTVPAFRVDVGLVRTAPGSLRANLTVVVKAPAALTGRAKLSYRVGTIRSWTQTNTAPTATRVLVAGAGTGTTKVWRDVHTTESDTAATAWGGHRVMFLQGPNSFDNPELDQAGKAQLSETVGTTALAVEAAEASGLLAFTDYEVGDQVTVELMSSPQFPVVDNYVSGISVTVDSGGPMVVPSFGDPNDLHPQLTMAQMIKAQRRRIRALEQRR